MILPESTDLKTWAASLVVDFPTDDIPLLSNELEWKEWGNRLIQSTSFSSSGAPNTFGFTNWRQWAQMFFFTMANN